MLSLGFSLVNEPHIKMQENSVFKLFSDLENALSQVFSSRKPPVIQATSNNHFYFLRKEACSQSTGAIQSGIKQNTQEKLATTYDWQCAILLMYDKESPIPVIPGTLGGQWRAGWDRI